MELSKATEPNQQMALDFIRKHSEASKLRITFK